MERYMHNLNALLMILWKKNIVNDFPIVMPENDICIGTGKERDCSKSGIQRSLIAKWCYYEYHLKSVLIYWNEPFNAVFVTVDGKINTGIAVGISASD